MKTRLELEIQRIRLEVKQIRQHLDGLDVRCDSLENRWMGVNGTVESQGTLDLTPPPAVTGFNALPPSIIDPSVISGLAGTASLERAEPDADPPALSANVPESWSKSSNLSNETPMVAYSEDGTAVQNEDEGHKQTTLSEVQSTLEGKLGQYWFVRIGVVMLLTSLAFFGNYAYEHISGWLGAWGKLSLMTLACVGLVGGGRRLMKGEGRIAEFGEVLVGGGLAGFYFTIFAAHHLVPLRVIESTITASVLLLSYVCFLFWYADRTRKRSMAVMAVFMAYYTTSIQPVRHFALFGSLLLSSGVVILTIRRGWDILSGLGMVAVYGGFGYWQYFKRAELQMVESGVGLAGIGYLTAYWILFAISALIGFQQRGLGGNGRFVILNNLAYVLLAGHGFWQGWETWFWVFPTSFAVVNLVIAFLIKTKWQRGSELFEYYFLTGILCSAWGAVAWFSGMQLALVLGVQSLMVIWYAEKNDADLERGLGIIGVLLATALSCLGFSQELGAFRDVKQILLATLYWGMAIRIKRAGLAERDLSKFVVGMLVSGGTFLWWFVFKFSFSVEAAIVGSILLAVVGLVTMPLHRLESFVWAGEGMLLSGVGFWIAAEIGPGNSIWIGALVVGALFGLCKWWLARGIEVFEISVVQVLEWVHTTIGMLVVCRILDPRIEDNTWLWVGGWVSMIAMLLSQRFQIRTLEVTAQIPMCLSVYMWLRMLFQGDTSSIALLIPIAWILLFGWGVNRFKSSLTYLGRIGWVYYSLAASMFAGWLVSEVPAGHRSWPCLLVSTAVWIANRHKGERRIRIEQFFGLLGLGMFWIDYGNSANLRALELVGLGVFLVQPGFGSMKLRNEPSYGSWERMIAYLGWLSVWVWLNRWVGIQGGGFYYVVAWALFGGVVMGTGLLCNNRDFRNSGLIALGVALLRVLIIDVWGLEALGRILSFLVFGMVLIGLGFAYNKRKSL